MRSVVKAMFSGEKRKKILSIKDTLENTYGLFVSKTGKSVEGLPEDLEEAGYAYDIIHEALYDGDKEYI